jgi:hypothetical protein
MIQDSPLNRRIVLLTGIPASGKSTYGRWLESTKGFLYVDIENGGLEPAGLSSHWKAMFGPNGSTSSFVAALNQMGRPIILDWGFPPHCLPIVESLKYAGVEVWWFDGERNAARNSFVQRGTVSVQCLDVQMGGIERDWSAIMRVVGDRVIDTVKSGPQYQNPEIIFTRMFPDLVD